MTGTRDACVPSRTRKAVMQRMSILPVRFLPVHKLRALQNVLQAKPMLVGEKECRKMAINFFSSTLLEWQCRCRRDVKGRCPKYWTAAGAASTASCRWRILAR